MQTRRIAILIVVAGLLLTAAASWTAAELNRHNEDRLLLVQTHQAASVLSATILDIRHPLETALQTAIATNGDAERFRQFMSSNVGPHRLFVSSSLWRNDGSAPLPVTSLGVPPDLAEASRAATAFIELARHSPTFVVRGIPRGMPERVGYAIADPQQPNLVVYAERQIPANRRVPVESTSAFADLHFATYLGTGQRISKLATTDLPPQRLPITGGRTAHVAIPFGNTTLTLVTAPARQLGGALGATLPWVFLTVGVLLTLVAAFVTVMLMRRRTAAEHDAELIAGLYEEVATLYGRQRVIVETLQTALLPQRNPTIPGIEVAARYVAGGTGVDVGGDWYSMIRVDDERFAFVVGDVMGHGLEAAAVMAQMRFTIRAYFLEGHPPETVLGMCSQQIDIVEDGHFVTAIVGMADVASRTITLANAGHLAPLLISETAAQPVTMSAGPALGIMSTDYPTTKIEMPPGSALLAFTDGLIERRGEDIQLGVERLASTTMRSSGDLDAQLSAVLAELIGGGSEDDTTVLAFRWSD